MFKYKTNLSLMDTSFEILALCLEKETKLFKIYNYIGIPRRFYSPKQWRIQNFFSRQRKMMYLKISKIKQVHL